MKKTMKKYYIIRKRKNQTVNTANYKYKKLHRQYGGILPSAKLVEEVAEEAISTNKGHNIIPSNIMYQNSMNDMGMNNMGMNNMGMNDMGMNDMGMNDMGMNDMGMNQVDPSQLHQFYDNPFKLITLWNLAVQPIPKIIAELYNILKTGNIKNPDEVRAKLDKMANEIKDPDVKNQVLNYNSEIMNVYLNSIAPSINIISNILSQSVTDTIINVINNLYIYVIDNAKMYIEQKQNNIVNYALNTTSHAHFGLEFLNKNLITPPTDNNNLDNRFYTDQYIQEGGNKTTHDSNKNSKIHNKLVFEINKSLQDY